jgi:hypothetical protein
MIRKDEDHRFWREFSHYDLSLRVADLHRQRRELYERMGAVEVEAARRAIAHVYLSRRGIEVGAGTRPLPIPEHATVSYGDIRDASKLIKYFENTKGAQIAVSFLLDAQTFADVADAVSILLYRRMSLSIYSIQSALLPRRYEF